MRTGQPREFVEVDLPGHRRPPHACHWVIVEQKTALDSDTSSEFERSCIEYEQIHSPSEGHLERDRWIRRPPRCHIKVRVGTLIAASLAAEEESETSTVPSQHGDHFVNVRCGTINHETSMSRAGTSSDG
jgi:hypothetical protein